MLTKQQMDNRPSTVFTNSFLILTPLVCSLMVIMIHQHNAIAPAASVSARVISFFTHGICTVAVPTFFLMSGYLFFRNIHNLSDVFAKQKKRVKTVLIPFLAWSSLYYLLFAGVSVLLPGKLSMAVEISLYGIVRGVVFYEHAFLLWYMFQLCMYILVAPVLFCVLKNKVVSIALLICVAVLGLFGPSEISVDVGTFQRDIFQFNFFAYFFLGSILARWGELDAHLAKITRGIPAVILVGIFIACGMLESLFFDGMIPSFSKRCFVPLVFISFVLLMRKLCDQSKKFSRPKVSTMIVYGVHPAVGIVLNEMIFDRFQFQAVPLFVLSFLAVTVGSFAVAWVLRWIKPIHRVLSGNR